MSTNRITLIRGTAKTVIIDLVDGDGQPLSTERLAGALGAFVLRTAPDAVSNLLAFDTSNAVHMRFIGSKLSLSFLDADTPAIDLGTYTYRTQVTLSDGSSFDVVPWTPFYLTLGGTDAPSPPVFDNTVRVDHNWEGTDTLAYATPGGSPIPDAQVRLYRKSDYDAGRLSAPLGVTNTDAYGKWRAPILVAPGYSYVIQFFKPGEFGPNTATIIA